MSDVHPSHPRDPAWKWWVCGLLLLATMINYMDRQTLNLTAKRIMDDFRLDERDYGQLESAFANAFAIGAIIVGWMVDRWNVRWIYPTILLAWSLMGFATGLVQGFLGLLVCRFLLGLAEAGNWPCALRTTQHILPPEKRTMGNGILQSGAAFGAILTPLIVLACVALTNTWRYPFLVVGAVGFLWVILWLMVVRPKDLEITGLAPSPSLVKILLVLVILLALDVAAHVVPLPPEWASLLPFPVSWFPGVVKLIVSGLGIVSVVFWLIHVTRDDTTLPRSVFFRRFGVLMVLVVAINLTWHFFRAWLPLFLQKQHHYSESFSFWFIMAYYIATDLGSLFAGMAALHLAQNGVTVFWSRAFVFLLFSLVTLLSLVAAILPAGPLLLGVLLIIGFAALGLFPNYYSFSQELTVRHQGKVTGALGCINWLAMAPLHEFVGESIKQTGSYSQGMALAGLPPFFGFLVLIFFWGKTSTNPKSASAPT